MTSYQTRSENKVSIYRYTPIKCFLLPWKAVPDVAGFGKCYPMALYFFWSCMSRGSTFSRCMSQTESSARSSSDCRQEPSPPPPSITFLHTISIILSFYVSMPPQSASSHHNPNRPFPRSMRSQGKRSGRGSRQTGAVFEA